MDTMRLDQASIAEIIPEWLDAINRLFADVAGWAQEQNWTVASSTTEISEESLGKYTAPVLTIDAQNGRLVLEPIARIVIGGKGRIDLYAWPTLYRVMLLRRSKDTVWVVRTDSGLAWPNPWGRETFISIANGLLEANQAVLKIASEEAPPGSDSASTTS